MTKIAKACPLVLRQHDGRTDILAFQHPLAGKQFVKGTVKPGEPPSIAAARELKEESGLILAAPLIFLGVHQIGVPRQDWHFYQGWSSGLPETWHHQTEDDFGHVFSFFWHPIETPLDDAWHPVFHEAFGYFVPRL